MPYWRQLPCSFLSYCGRTGRAESYTCWSVSECWDWRSAICSTPTASSPPILQSNPSLISESFLFPSESVCLSVYAALYSCILSPFIPLVLLLGFSRLIGSSLLARACWQLRWTLPAICRSRCLWAPLRSSWSFRSWGCLWLVWARWCVQLWVSCPRFNAWICRRVRCFWCGSPNVWRVSWTVSAIPRKST